MPNTWRLVRSFAAPAWDISSMRPLGIYAAGQGISYAIDMSLFCLCDHFLPAFNVGLSYILSKSLSALFSFFYHDRLSFREDEKGSELNKAASFIAVVLINIFATSALMGLFSSYVPGHIVFDKLVCDTFGVIITYVLLRFYVFARSGAL